MIDFSYIENHASGPWRPTEHGACKPHESWHDGYLDCPTSKAHPRCDSIRNRSTCAPLLEQRRHLDQRRCHYIPHILLVPKNTALSMQSSDATLHTIHMEGAASFNLPFPFQNQVSSRIMGNPGLVHLRCNGGHVWMSAEMMVVSHPYYAVTDESGHFEFTNVPPGSYQIVAWHEGWGVAGREHAYDVLTEHRVERPVFTEPRTWEKAVTVGTNQESTVNF